MGRKAKPYLRTQTNSWYCSIGGKQIPLGKSKREAFVKFERLICEKGSDVAKLESLYSLSQIYLDWCQSNRSEKLYDNHRRFLKGFIESVGKRLRIDDLKRHHLTKWLEDKVWSDTTKNDAISAVQRMLNWAIEEGYFSVSPIQRVKKPRRKPREIVYSREQYDEIRAFANPTTRDLIDFLWWTGCRPFEARRIEQRHVHNDLVIFPPSESKGERQARVIVLVPQASVILDRLDRPDGPLLRNSRGRPWTKDAVKCQFQRLSQKVGYRVIAYGFRHSFGTNSILNNVDVLSVSHLMGHSDTRMVSQVYSHISKNFDFLRSKASAAVGSDANR
jgi:integrase